MTKETAGEDVKRMLEGRGSWQGLNKITKGGTATKKILSILPEETLSTMLRINRFINLSLKGKSYSELRRTESVFEDIERDFKHIHNLLRKHQFPRPGDSEYDKWARDRVMKWLTKEDVEDIMKYIQCKFIQSPKGVKTSMARTREIQKRRVKQTRPPDEALNITIYLLSQHLKKKTEKPHWDLIFNFLVEQKVIEPNETMKGMDLKQRIKNMDEAKLQSQYEFYRELYPIPDFNMGNQWPHEMRVKLYMRNIYQRDLTLPAWSDLVPD